MAIAMKELLPFFTLLATCSIPLISSSATLSKEEVPCTMCYSCENPCQRVPVLPPPPALPESPPPMPLPSLPPPLQPALPPSLPSHPPPLPLPMQLPLPSPSPPLRPPILPSKPPSIPLPPPLPPPLLPECPPPPPQLAPESECSPCTKPPPAVPSSPMTPPVKPTRDPPPAGAVYFSPPLYGYNTIPVYMPNSYPQPRSSACFNSGKPEMRAILLSTSTVLSLLVCSF